MPSSTEILDLMTRASGEQASLAVAWHLAILAAVVAVLAGWRPSVRFAVLLLVAPAVSVAAIATQYANPFNVLSFGLLASLLAAAAGALDDEYRVARGPLWTVALGGLLIAYGFVYPHFVEGPWYRALYASPVGVAPCPTLAILAGFTLLAGGFGTRAIPAGLALWTAFYAVYGIFQLGVVLDIGLAIAALGLVAIAVAGRRATSAPRSYARRAAATR